MDDPIWQPLLLGSCDGLVCLAVPSGFLLNNPTTQESRNFPGSFLVQGDECFHGFGWHSTSYDNKIVPGDSSKKMSGGVAFAKVWFLDSDTSPTRNPTLLIMTKARAETRERLKFWFVGWWFLIDCVTSCTACLSTSFNILVFVCSFTARIGSNEGKTVLFFSDVIANRRDGV